MPSLNQPEFNFTISLWFRSSLKEYQNCNDDTVFIEDGKYYCYECHSYDLDSSDGDLAKQTEHIIQDIVHEESPCRIYWLDSADEGLLYKAS